MLFSPILQQQVQVMHRTPLLACVGLFTIVIASHVFHGHNSVEAHLDDISWVHFNNISFDLGGDVVDILCTHDRVDGTKLDTFV